METYHQSVLEYSDVRQVANYAEKEGVRKGRRKGRKEGIEIGEKRGIDKIIRIFYANNMSIGMIAKYTGFTEEQIHNILTNE
ncbi:MAG: hypothetical protein LBD76_01445 [Prevotellaceae bacterium]|jgi:predicted transposase/invertase (TIGR01784 family)|nr:hypothetical protein [Prevotellaceae bacterium]